MILKINCCPAQFESGEIKLYRKKSRRDDIIIESGFKKSCKPRRGDILIYPIKSGLGVPWFVLFYNHVIPSGLDVS